MAIVINEFEVITQPVAPRAQGAPAAASDRPAARHAPGDVAQLLRVLQVQALRAWAH